MQLGTLRRELRKLHKETQSWRKTGARYGINPAMARLLVNGYEPGQKIRKQLGLPEYRSVPPCSICGGVHLKKTCPTTRTQKWDKLIDIPVKVLRWKLIHREELSHVA